MYQSPLRDGGYDIADFFAIHPDYGTVDDFREFVEQAHQRGMRVIADLVMNHTSADHPWFQESRSDPAGPKGDWYVWSDTDERYGEARIIFIDTRAVELDVRPACAASTTGTASSTTSPTSTTTTPRCRRRCSTCCASGSTSASTASGSTPCPISSSAKGRTARTSPRRTST